MSFRINTNVTAMNALRNLNNSSDMLSASIDKLSSGLRINTAADDPAGLVISQKFDSQVNGLNQAVQNSQDGINYAKTAEGALSEVSSLLAQARTLAVAANNTGVESSVQTQADQAQLASIQQSITRIASNTQFGTKYLLNGSAGVSAAVTDATKIASLNIGGTFNGVALATGSAVTVTVTTAATPAVVTLNKTFATAGTAATAGSFTINGVTITTTAADTEATVQQKINAVQSQTGITANYTTGGGIVLTTATYGSSSKINVADANGVVQGAPNTATGAGVDAVAQVGINGTTVTFTGGLGGNDGLSLKDGDGNVIRLTTAGNSTATANATVGQVSVGSAQFQIGANAGQVTQLSLGNFAASQLGTTAVSGLNIGNIDLTTGAGATNAILVIDAAIDQVSSARGNIGAFQSDVLQTNINSLQVASQNLASAESDIRDVDMSSEMTNYSKEQVLVQAGTSVLSQANSSSQQVLTLLKNA